MTIHTPDQKRRIIEAILECDRLIEKEEKYRADLQHTDMLNSYRIHRRTLQLMLSVAP